MASVTIEEFLVSLGFNIDENSYRKFNETLFNLGKQVELFAARLAPMAEAAAAVGVAVVAMSEKIAEQFTKLKYASDRSDSTVSQLQQIAYGFSAIGISADQAKNMVENFGTSLRTDKSIQTRLSAMGIHGGTPASQFLDVIKYFVKMDKSGPMGPVLVDQLAGDFGLNEATIHQIGANMEAFQKAIADFNEQQEKIGLDQSQLAKDSVALSQALGKLWNSVELFGEWIASGLVPVMTKVVNWMNGLVDDPTGPLAGALRDLMSLPRSTPGIVETLKDRFGGI